MAASIMIGLRGHVDWLEMVSLYDTFVLMFLIPFWNDARRRYRTAKMAFMSNGVEMYVGQIDGSMRAEPAKDRLKAAGLRTAAGEQRLNRLSPSAIVLSIDGALIRRQFRVGASEIAGTVDKSSFLFPARLSHSAMWMNLGDRRNLANNELIELKRHAKAFKPKLNIGAALVVLFFGGMAVARLFAPMPRNYEFWFALSMVLTVASTITAAFGHAIHNWRLISRDLDDGYVFLSNEYGGVEFLPNSRMIWTQRGQPCLWRRVAARDIRD